MHCIRILSLIAFCFAAAACSNEPGTLKIGVAMPLSGPLAEEGRSLLQAAELAAEQIRAGGTGVRLVPLKVQIVPADDKGDDSHAPAAAAALASKGVSAVIGHLTSGASIAAAPIYAKADIVQLSMGTHPNYTRLGLSTTFRLFANDLTQAQALGRYCTSEYKGRRFAVIDDGSVYGRALAEAVRAELDGARERVVHRRTYEPAATTFPVLAAAMVGPNAPEVVVTTMELAQARALVKALVDADRTNVVVIGGDTLKTGPVPAEAARLRGYLSTTPVTDLREFGSAGQNFVRRCEQRYGHAPVDTAHYIYDAVYLLAQAAELERSSRSEALNRALRRIDPSLPVTGSIRFRDDGELRFGAISLYGADKGQWRLITRGTVW